MSVLEQFDEIYYDLSKLSAEDIYFRKRINSLGNDQFKFDALNFNTVKPDGQSFHDYFFEPFRLHQPNTYAILSNIDEQFFYAIERSKLPRIMDDITAFGIEFNNIVIYLDYYPNIEKFVINNRYNFPQEIIQSWLLRSSGWHIAQDTTVIDSLGCSGLPSDHNPPIGSVYRDLKAENQQAQDKIVYLEDKFNQPLLIDYENNDIYETHFQLSSLIDTRNNGKGQNKNFQIFSCVNHKTQEMYLIQDEDIYSIQKLVNPAEAIDKYAAHLFSRQEGYFDFSKYAEDF